MRDVPAKMQSLSRSPRLVDAVVEQLRDSIVSGALPAGTKLLQVELAEQLGVSRTPLREAFRVLENEGMVQTSDNERTIKVVSLDAEDVREMFELREVIDGIAARLTAKHGLPPSDEREARELLEELDKTSEYYVPEQRNRLHTQFHELIGRASRNTKVETFFPLIRASSSALYVPAVRSVMAENVKTIEGDVTLKEALLEAQRQHKDILDAILERDQQRAEETARAHIRRTLHLVPRLQQLGEDANHDESAN